MSVHRLLRKMAVALLVAAAVVTGSRLAGPVAARASDQSVAGAGSGQVKPHTMPPILAPATQSELAIIRQGETQEADASAYAPPASAPYSLAMFNGYVRAGK